MAGRLPDFLIIGAMKSGTTSLHEQLARRPGIFVSGQKEPNFFSNDEEYERGIDWYTGLFAAARSDQVCGEASTHYTKLPTYPRSLERMQAHLENVKLIYMMRHPIDRIVSQYIHEWTQREVAGSLEAALEQHERYTAYSSYARQLEPYLEAYGSNAILPLFFERMLTAPDEKLERVCAFIGDPTPLPPVWDRTMPPQNVSRDRLRRSALRESLLSVPALSWLKEQMPEPVRNRIKSFWQMRRRPQIPARLQRRIEARIDEDLARLGDWLGIELTCANWHEQVMAAPADWKGLQRTDATRIRPMVPRPTTRTAHSDSTREPSTHQPLIVG